MGSLCPLAVTQGELRKGGCGSRAALGSVLPPLHIVRLPVCLSCCFLVKESLHQFSLGEHYLNLRRFNSGTLFPGPLLCPSCGERPDPFPLPPPC